MLLSVVPCRCQASGQKLNLWPGQPPEHTALPSAGQGGLGNIPNVLVCQVHTGGLCLCNKKKGWDPKICLSPGVRLPGMSP